MVFLDRFEAGRQLAKRLARFAPEHPLVLAVPPGGVPVGYEVALRLEAPLDVIELPVPGAAPRAVPGLRGRAVILVDDGFASAEPVRAATIAVAEHGAARIVVAAPVVSPDVVDDLGSEVDELVVLDVPPDLISVGYWYARSERPSEVDARAMIARACDAAVLACAARVAARDRRPPPPLNTAAADGRRWS